MGNPAFPTPKPNVAAPAAPVTTVSAGVKLEQILMTLQAITTAAGAFPVVGPFATLAAQFEAIAIAAIDAHNAAVGTPLDLTKLNTIDQIP